MLKAKKKLNYRRGYSHSHCGICDAFVPDHPIALIGGGTKGVEPRCKLLGLESGRMYRVNQKNICDRFDNRQYLERLKGGQG